jgi:hypothetical protein
VYPPVAEQAAPARHGRVVAVRVVLAICCLVAALVVAQQAMAMLTVKPTAGQRRAAEQVAVAQRWRSWSAGRIFPAALGYRTQLLTTETATRVGISRADSCRSALSLSAASAARQSGCTAALRASYVDEPQGVVYTVGVLAFARSGQARLFVRELGGFGGSLASLRALALAGTPSARFTDAARQLGAVRQAGPFVVLSVAGYVDGEPAALAGQRRPSVFAPASQLAAEIARPLLTPAVVDCAARQWSC